LQQNFTHTRCSSSSFIVNLSLIRRAACARAQFSGCSTKTNAHSEAGQMAVCCQNLRLGALSSRRAPSLLVGALFKKFCLFLNTPRMTQQILSVQKHLSRTIHASEISNCSGGRCIWDWCISLTSSGIKLCAFFLRLSPLPHPASFKVRELDCRNTQPMAIAEATGKKKTKQTNKPRDKYPCCQRNSKPRPQKSNSFRPTP